MNSRIEKQFETIAEEAVKAAEKVQCTIEDFAEGLKMIEDSVRERRELES